MKEDGKFPGYTEYPLLSAEVIFIKKTPMGM
jgi:hypothetical protein